MASYIGERASRSATIASTPPSVLYGLQPEFSVTTVNELTTMDVSVQGFKQYTILNMTMCAD